MHERGELAADPDDLALATLAALLLTQMHRNTRPLEKSLDTMLAHIESCATGGERASTRHRPGSGA